MSTVRCHEVLSAFGVEGPQVKRMQRKALRDLISKLKRQSHLSGDCNCPAAGYIQRGGGTKPATRPTR